jgi:amidase
MPECTLWSASRQAAAIRSGEITSRQLLEAVIARIEQLDPAINAVVTRDFERAREQADAADAAQAKGLSWGRLHGLPVTIKDALMTEGLRSTGGGVELRDNIPDQDAPVVAAIREQGAIIIGKTNLPRWSGDFQTYNELFGTTNNPWDKTRVPAGSSGGAAAAVATGMSSFEIGTDIGGSIRQPAAYCGIFGHKPSYGIVPSTGYLDHAGGGKTEADINVIGPLARSAQDLELVLDILVKKQPPMICALQPAPAELKTLRIAAWLDDSFCPVDQQVLDVCEKVVTSLRGAGYAVDTSARPDFDPAAAADLGMTLVGLAAVHAFPELEIDDPLREFSLSSLSHKQWLDMHAARETVRGKWAEFFQRFDIVLMPVSFVQPFPHNQQGDLMTRTLQCNAEARPYLDAGRWTTLVGMAYLPSTVPPIGLSEDGLPVGIQVVGPFGSDYRTIRMAAAIADLCGGFQPPPL